MLARSRLTPSTRWIVDVAIDEADRRRDPCVGTEHLLLAVASATAARPVLASAFDDRLDRERLREALDDLDRSALWTVGIDASPPAPRAPRGGGFRGRRPSPRFAAATRRALADAVGEARDVGRRRAEPEHLLLALTSRARVDPLGSDRAGAVLKQVGVDPLALRMAVRTAMGGAAV